MKTILWKELSEQAYVLPIALVLTAVATLYVWLEAGILFDEHGMLCVLTGVVGGVIATTLGILQSWPDKRPAARALLLHRALSPLSVFWGKLFAGWILYSVAMFVPLVGLALRLALDRQQSTAAYPDAVLPSMLVAVAAFTCWPAAVLTVHREALFYGSRLLPAGATLLVVMISSLAAKDRADLVAVLAFSFLSPLVMTLAARSAFVSGDPTGWGRVALAITTTVAFCGIGILGIFISENLRRPVTFGHETYSVQLGPDGEAWLVLDRSTYPHGLVAMGNHARQAAKIQSGGSAARPQLEPVAEDWQALPAWSISKHLNLHAGDRSGWPSLRNPCSAVATSITNPKMGYQRWWVYDNRSRQMLVYDQQRGIRLRNRLQPTGGSGSTRFSSLVGARWARSLESDGFLLVFVDAVYHFGSDGKSVKSVYQVPQGRELVATAEGGSYFGRSYCSRFLRLDDRLVLLRNQLSEAQRDGAVPLGEFGAFGQIHASEIKLPQQALGAEQLQFGFAPDDTTQMVALAQPGPLAEEHEWLRFDTAGRIEDQRTFRESLAGNTPPSQVEIAGAFFPLSIWVIAGIADTTLVENPTMTKSAMQMMREEPTTAATFCVLLIMQTALAVGLTWWAARRRQLSPAITRRWCGVALLCGPLIAFTLLAVYRQIVNERCRSCQQWTRRDRERCGACDHPLDESTRSGVEVFEEDAPARLPMADAI